MTLCSTPSAPLRIRTWLYVIVIAAMATTLGCAHANGSAKPDPVPPPVEEQPREPEEWFVNTEAYPSALGANKRTGSGGDSKSKGVRSCTTASEGDFIAQSLSKVSGCTTSGEQFAQCWIDFSDFVDIQPGVKEPRTACTSVFVRSKSGYNNRRKNAKVDGAFLVTTAESSPSRYDAKSPVEKSLPKFKATTPGLYHVEFDPDELTPIRLVLPLESVEEVAAESIRFSLNKAMGFGRLTRLDFLDYANDSPSLGLTIGIDSFAVRCNPQVRFWIPHARPLEFQAQIGRVDPDCDDRSVLASVGGAQNAIGKGITDALVDMIEKSLDGSGVGSDKFDEWARKDPHWAAFMNTGHVQGRYCDSMGRPSLCVELSWDFKEAWRAHVHKLLKAAPTKAGRIPSRELEAERKRSLEAAQSVRKPSTLHPGFVFPAAKDDKGGWRDRDVVIYAGLLCLSGEQQGCEAVKRAQTPHTGPETLFTGGRMWRSPDLRGDLLSPEQRKGQKDSFSGDQMNGYVAYLLKAGDAESLKAYIHYLTRHSKPVPSREKPVDTVYRFCDDGQMTCYAGGPDWYWVNLLARKLNLLDLVPAAERDVLTRYGFGPDAIYWQAAMNPAGYRLHLTGIQILLARRLGVEHVALDKAAAVLASRQPKNPFYLYLHLGKDKRVFDAAREKCSIMLGGQTANEDWAWQNTEVEEKWKTGVHWDCVFIYNLLK